MRSKTKKMKQASNENQSGARIASNEDLLTEILIRLPVTSILRFKSVSKHWQLLLTNSHLTRRYDSNLSKSPGLFVCIVVSSSTLKYVIGDIYVPFDVENRIPPPFRTLDYYFNRSDVRIKQSCNGLLLCYTIHNGAREYYVFNPTTKQLAFIPSVPGEDSVSKTICSMALAFHQTDCVHYKLVSLHALDHNEKMFQIQVYSSDTGKWKICSKSIFLESPVIGEPVYWNGAIHWAPYFNGRNYLYFKLDVEQMHISHVLGVFEYYDDIMVLYFGESRGHLHLVFHPDDDDNFMRVNVYERLIDHSGWFVKYQVELDALVGDFPCMISQHEGGVDLWNIGVLCERVFRVVDVARDKEEKETMLVLATPWKLIRYNIHDKSFKELCSFKHGCFDCHRYIENLSSF